MAERLPDEVTLPAVFQYEAPKPHYRKVLRDTQCKGCRSPLEAGGWATWFYQDFLRGYWCKKCHNPDEGPARVHQMYSVEENTPLVPGAEYCLLAWTEKCADCGVRMIRNQWVSKLGIRFWCSDCRPHYNADDPGRPF